MVYLVESVVLVCVVVVCFVQDWAAPANMDKLDVKWHVPSTSELFLVDKFLEEFLEPAMNGLTDMMEGRKQMDR